jgi:hypothetical protein
MCGNQGLGRTASNPGRPLGPVSLGSGPLGPHIKYTPMVMMILTLVKFTLSSLEMLQIGTYVPEIK